MTTSGPEWARRLRRVLPPAAAALAAFAVCVAGSVFRRVRLVARVDDVSVWTALDHRWHMVLTSWRASLTPLDWLLFAGVAALAAGAVAARPVLGRFAEARRRTE
jgi:hypothetical protein